MVRHAVKGVAEPLPRRISLASASCRRPSSMVAFFSVVCGDVLSCMHFLVLFDVGFVLPAFVVSSIGEM